MLSRENIEQLIAEHEVFERDRALQAYDLGLILLTIGQRRAEELGRGDHPWLDDGLFAAWAICIPGFYNPESYTRLMRNRMSEYFDGATTDEVIERARDFFPASFLSLHLHQLGNLVSSPNGADWVERHLFQMAVD
jgi:hypothetical protein